MPCFYTDYNIITPTPKQASHHGVCAVNLGNATGRADTEALHKKDTIENHGFLFAAIACNERA